jgi:crotonobetainyl-CoA:carnitine CoA-transferase CaiB-like acyl-CoA transferase
MIAGGDSAQRSVRPDVGPVGALALTGCRVVDLTTLLPGPFATLMLAEAGADVIKIEPPGGDPMRHFGPFVNGVGVSFAQLNRGKRSVSLNLKVEDDRQQLSRLISEADVVVEQFRPGVMERLGFGFEQASRLREDLIYCSITGYGQDGPAAAEAGHDLNYLARSGILSASSGPPRHLPVALADLAGGAYPAFHNILLALLRRQITGQGAYIDVAMYESVFALAYSALAKVEAGEGGSSLGHELRAGNSPRYGFYETADGRYLAVAAIEDAFWIELCDCLGVDEHDRDDRADPARSKAAVALQVRARTADEWRLRLAGCDTCCSVVQTMPEAVADPQTRARDVFSARVWADGAEFAALPVPLASGLRDAQLLRSAPWRLDELPPGWD